MAMRSIVGVLFALCAIQIVCQNARAEDTRNGDLNTIPMAIKSKGPSAGGKYLTKRQTSARMPPTPSARDLDASVKFGRDVISRMTRLEQNLNGAAINVRRGSPAHGQLIDSCPSRRALQRGKEALVAVKASGYLLHNHCRRYGIDEAKCARLVSTFNMTATSLGAKCKPTSDAAGAEYCTTSKYRSYDGACNHVGSTRGEGQAFTGYRRLLAPDYGDGIQLPRENVRGKTLPNARLISTRFGTRDGNKVEDDITLALMQWSQFVEHDMTHTPVSKMSNTDGSIDCCKPDGGALKPRYLHPACLPVMIPRNDPYYSSSRGSDRNVQCMNYVRSVAALRKDCTFGPLEQMNQATHYLDGSMLYGTTAEKARSLRRLDAGLLVDAAKADGRRFMADADEPRDACQAEARENTTTCYRAGDTRVNAHPHLTAMYTVWHRHHNRLAAALHRVNPAWGDERLYQEARRIVVAEIQHVTYDEWLPVVLGDKFSRRQGIGPKRNAYHFDDRVDPSVSNSFATAALRFVHSMMDSRLRLYDEERHDDANSSLLLREHFNRPWIVEEDDNLDSLVRGLATQNSQKSDLDYVEDITGQLYQNGNPYGLDIISLDVQRGRDHGLPGYNRFRKMCGLPAATSFDHFGDVIPKPIVTKLRAVYNHPDDVDLLIGGMSEQPSEDSLLGTTFRCILGEQFARTMKGDRFFYEIQNQPNSFTPEQLKALKKVTLARIFCDNGDSISMMQPNVFRKPSSSNELVRCYDAEKIPRLNLDLWAEPRKTSS